MLLIVRWRFSPFAQIRAFFGDSFGDRVRSNEMAGHLSARFVLTAKPGKYSDGGNLYLVVSPSNSRKWVLRFTWRGRAKEMGLGSAAKAKGFRTGENPATWRGHLEHFLAKPAKLTRGHHAAMPYEEVPSFIAEL